MIWKSMTNYAEPLIKSLNGQIILIKGNHDNFIKNAKAKKALAGVKDYDDIVVTLKNGVKRRCILCHYYMPFYVGHRYQTILLHGHSHESEEAYLEKEISKMLSILLFDISLFSSPLKCNLINTDSFLKKCSSIHYLWEKIFQTPNVSTHQSLLLSFSPFLEHCSPCFLRGWLSSHS